MGTGDDELKRHLWLLELAFGSYKHYLPLRLAEWGVLNPDLSR